VRKIDPRNFQRATRTTTKDINRQIVLNLVREYQPISRADLARRMEVARGIVTPLVNELIEQGLLVEGAMPAPRRAAASPRCCTCARTTGWPSPSTCASPRRSSCSPTSAAGRSPPSCWRTPAEPAELVAALAARIRRLLRRARRPRECQGIGLVVPGMVDRATGRLVNAPTLGWRDVDLRGALEEAVGLPVHVERDAVACALAQMWMGQGAAGATASPTSPSPTAWARGW
jgi:N-acetylglucosamine repressor